MSRFRSHAVKSNVRCLNQRRFTGIGGLGSGGQEEPLFPQPLEIEQVLYRYLSMANPCFSHGLCNEELNDLVQLPLASHKTEQPG
jgi:hypothetical protein